MKKSQLLIFMMIGMLAVSLMGQTRLRCKQISLEQGLSQSSIFTIVQDKKGFLWIGTESGLNRYDGYQFKIYMQEGDDPNSLSNSDDGFRPRILSHPGFAVSGQGQEGVSVRTSRPGQLHSSLFSG